GTELLPALPEIRNDFANYYVPARLVRAGVPLARAYETEWFQNEIRRAGIDRLGGFASFPPASALLLWPLAGLAPAAAKLGWALVLAAAYLASYLVLRPVAGLSGALLALVFLLPGASLANALRFGQPYPLLLLLLALSLRALLAGRGFLAGALLAPVFVLKLYGAAFLLHFLWARRWRAAAGFAAGAAVLTALSLAALGPAVHVQYLREQLPALLRGEYVDSYSPAWQTVASVSRRLFQAEPELNPHPALDAPALARGLGAGLSSLVLLLSAFTRAEGPRALPRTWAALAAGSLAASPVLASYHFVLLVLPVALLAGDPELDVWMRAALLALLVFATSPYAFALADRAQGWANLVAAPRLLATLLVFAAALWLLGRPRPWWPAPAAALLAALLAARGQPAPGWERLAGPRGPAGDPVACEGTVAWVTAEGERLVVRAADGRAWSGPGDTFGPRCDRGRLTVAHSVGAGEAGAPVEAGDQDVAPDGAVVRAEPGRDGLREVRPAGERLLAPGRVLHPRVSPDGQWVACQRWSGGDGWDVVAVERASGRVVLVAASRRHEQQPSWSPDGRSVLFASDWNRGLGYGTVYRTSFAP
ncbi:MAG TPA: glycosyltransferase 87 family protein, partial [Vicinamibacteria bacterium]